MKLKQLLEGYAWERKAGAPLPTLADATAKHQANIKEQEFDEDGHFGIPFEHDSAVVHAFNRVVASYRDATKGMDDDQAYSVSQQLTEFFS
tara:strand:+ start:604 stop:876 length:273 start_codon:yes stop_codon:yes gene_type:complete